MSAMEEAFAKLGLRPAQAKTKEDARVERQQAAPDFRSMTDDDLANAIAQLEQDRIVISEELDADLREGMTRGKIWRQAAGRARAFRIAHLKMARDEEAARRPVKEVAAKAPEKAERMRAAQAAQAAAQAAAEARAAAAREEAALRKIERDAAWQKRQARRARMFVLAAHRHLSREESAWIWNKARSMFPHAPEWDEK